MDRMSVFGIDECVRSEFGLFPLTPALSPMERENHLAALEKRPLRVGAVGASSPHPSPPTMLEERGKNRAMRLPRIGGNFDVHEFPILNL
jgi:hypothetical protein